MTVQVKILRRSDGDYRYMCGRTTTGRDWYAIGCQHLGPRDAHRHADRLEEPYVSPLRPPAEGSPAVLVPPLGTASVEPSAGARERVNRHRRG